MKGRNRNVSLDETDDDRRSKRQRINEPVFTQNKKIIKIKIVIPGKSAQPSRSGLPWPRSRDTPTGISHPTQRPKARITPQSFRRSFPRHII